MTMVLSSSPFCSKRVQNLADLSIHERDRSVVAADRLSFASADVHLHVDAGFVVDARLGDVVPVAFQLRGQHHFVVRLKRRVVLARSDERDMWPDETDAQPERFILMLLNQLHSFGSRLAVGVNHVVAVSFDNDEGVATDNGAFARLDCLPEFRHHRELSTPGRGC